MNAEVLPQQVPLPARIGEASEPHQGFWRR